MTDGADGSRAATPPAWLVPSLAALLAALTTLRLIDDPDYFTHLALGRALVEAGFGSIAEPFQWGWSEPVGSESLVFRLALLGARAVAGDPGVSVLVALLSAVTLTVVPRSAPSPRSWPRSALALALLALVLGPARLRMVARPELLATPLLAGALVAAARWARTGSHRLLLAMAALLWVAAMLHLSWVVGAGLAGATALLLLPADAWRARWASMPRWLRWGAPLAGAAAAIPMAAFAWRVWSQLQAGALSTITEMQPAWTIAEVFRPFALAVAAAAALAWGQARGRAGRLALVAMATVIGLVVVRNVTLASLALVPPALDGLAGWRPSTSRPLAALALAAGLLVPIGFAASALAERDPAPGLGLDLSAVPRDAAAFARPLPGPHFNTWDCGGWLDLTWAGAPRTFLDGRLLDPERVRDHDAIAEATTPEETLARLGLRTLLVEPLYRYDGALLQLVPWLLARPDWRLVRASDGLVFVKSSAAGDLPALPPAEGWRCVARLAAQAGARGGSARAAPFVEAWALAQAGELAAARSRYREAAARDPSTAAGYPALAR